MWISHFFTRYVQTFLTFSLQIVSSYCIVLDIVEVFVWISILPYVFNLKYTPKHISVGSEAIGRSMNSMLVAGMVFSLRKRQEFVFF